MGWTALGVERPHPEADIGFGIGDALVPEWQVLSPPQAPGSPNVRLV